MDYEYEDSQQSIYVASRRYEGKYKVYIMGQPAGHISDWRGCNYRVWSIKGQPHKGFSTKEEALAWVKKTFKSGYEVHQATSRGDGTFIKQGMFYETDYVTVKFKRKRTQKEINELKKREAKNAR